VRKIARHRRDGAVAIEVDRSMRLIRYIWAAPATLVGLVLALVAISAGARAHVVDGVVEVAGGWLARARRMLPFTAITFGHVVVGVSHSALRRLRAHEHVHVRQYERWGVLFFPLYLGSSLFALVRGRDAYRDNRFEREAFAQSQRAGARRPTASARGR